MGAFVASVDAAFHRDQFPFGLVAEGQEPTLVLSFRKLGTVDVQRVKTSQSYHLHVQHILLVGVDLHPGVAGLRLHHGAISIWLVTERSTDRELHVDGGQRAQNFVNLFDF